MNSMPAQQVSNAFDFSQFQKLKANAKNADEKTLRSVAQQFESIFIKMALDSMRKASKELESDLFKSSYQDFYQDMYDDQLSLNLAENGGIGLTDALVRYLSTQLSPEQVLNVNTQLQPSAEDSQAAFKRLLQMLEPYLNDLSQEFGVSKKAILSHAVVETGWGSLNRRENLGINLFGSPQRFGLNNNGNGQFKTIKEAIDNYQLFLQKQIDLVGEEKIADKDFFKMIQQSLYPKEPEKLQQFLKASKSSLLSEK